MERISLTLLILALTSSPVCAQVGPASVLKPDPDTSQRCVPSDVTYTHFGAIDEKTLILANENNDVMIATLRTACPRLLDEDRVMLLFRKGDGLSGIGSRMCADDAFMLIKSQAVSVNNGDSLRACEFRAFYSLPAADILDSVKANAVFFRSIGVF